MRILIQRVKHASVIADGQKTGEIGNGLLLFFGAGQGDTEELAEKMADKIVKLRIFEDENGKTNRSLADVGGGLLIVSQFTLYADCKKGNRPNFLQAAPPEQANCLYDYFVNCCKKRTGQVETGIFAALMEVELCNSGPFTLFLDSETLFDYNK